MASNTYYTTGRPDSECPIGEDIIAEPIKGNMYLMNGKTKSFHGSIMITHKKTGVVSTETATLKCADGFGYNIEEAYSALNCWKDMGYRGSPASAASFTREKYRELKRKKLINARCNASANNMIRDYFTGGWIETSVKGHFFQPVYHYDINKAYMHAASMGLPSALYPYNGDPDAIGYVVLLEPTVDISNLPNFLSPFMDDKLILVTNEDVETYKLKGRVVRGVQYYDLDVNLRPILDDLKKDLPESLWKKCTQTFWGMFASVSGLDVVGFDTRTDHKLWNRNQNIVWASLIIRRVAAKVYNAWIEYDGVSCFVDSLICTKKMNEKDIGTEIGQWKLEGEHKKGAYFEGAGVWHPLPFQRKSDFYNRSKWHKHSGHSH